MRKWPGEEYVRDFEALTDVVVQSDNDDLNIFEDRKFTFSLPKGTDVEVVDTDRKNLAKLWMYLYMECLQEREKDESC